MLSMGGYAAFIWPCYFITLALMLFFYCNAKYNFKQVIRRIKYDQESET